jgi:hypothetical protein
LLTKFDTFNTNKVFETTIVNWEVTEGLLFSSITFREIIRAVPILYGGQAEEAVMIAGGVVF